MSTTIVKITSTALVALLILGTVLYTLAIPAAIAAQPAPAQATAAAPQGCWTEHKPDGSTELLEGDITAAPVGATIADCPTS
jgi:hypothetical protein